jgi:cell shape-determining protein MreC
MTGEMDFQVKSAKERAAHYEQEAEKFRRIAEAEPVEHIRNELRALAAQYRRLAESLNARRRLTTN